MEQSNKQNKKMILTIVGIAILVIGLVGVTYAFFNYTRTGTANVIKTGKISFNSEQGTAINLTNMFPIDVSNGIPNDNTKVGIVTINVTGDTTYDEGIEYLVSAVNVQNTVGSGQNAKSLPISIDVSVANNTTNDPATTLGTADADYFTNRGGNSSIYKVLASETISNDGELLVGYITKGATGIDGNIVIKAYLDKAKIAITDTYDGNETDNMGTTTTWVNDRVTFTTQEWNSLQSSGVSFQIKVEANEGIWVTDPNGSQEEPWNATDASCFTYYEDGGEITITGYYEDTCGTDVVIPKEINNLNVTRIANDAFYDKGLTSVKFHDGIDYIGQYAFATNELTSITIPSGYIDGDAFWDNSITDVVILIGVIGMYNSDEYDCFPFRDNPLVNIYVDMIEISGNAFANSQFDTVTLGPHVQIIGETAFANTRFNSIIMSNSVTTIGLSAFSRSSLTTITIPSSVRLIDNFAFSNSQLSSITISNGVVTIGEYAFSESALTSVTIPSSVMTIKDFAFNGCNHLTSATIQGKDTPDDFDYYGEYIWESPSTNPTIVWEGKN